MADYRRSIAWRPLPRFDGMMSGQELALAAFAHEILFHGPRGIGKSDIVAAKCLYQIGRGYGKRSRQIIVRKHHSSLDDLVIRCERIFGSAFPKISLKLKPHARFTFPDGEMVDLVPVETVRDYLNKLHGHEFTGVGMDELTTWPDDQVLATLKSCIRSPIKSLRAWMYLMGVTNSWGPGHGIFKQRYKLFTQDRYTSYYKEGKQTFAIVQGSPADNVYLGDDYYHSFLSEPPDKRASYLFGSWDLRAGGIIDDVFSVDDHCLSEDVQLEKSHWHSFVSLDYGTSRPYALLMFFRATQATTIAPPLPAGDLYERAMEIPESQVRAGAAKNFLGRFSRPAIRVPAGTVIIARELYGWNGVRNVGKKTSLESEAGLIRRYIDNWNSDPRVPLMTHWGPADVMRTTTIDESRILLQHGMHFSVPKKRPGQRAAHYSNVRSMLTSARYSRMNVEHLYVMDQMCPQWMETCLGLERKANNPDDTHERAEDHLMDTTRMGIHGPWNSMRDVSQYVMA